MCLLFCLPPHPLFVCPALPFSGATLVEKAKAKQVYVMPAFETEPTHLRTAHKVSTASIKDKSVLQTLVHVGLVHQFELYSNPQVS